MSDLLERAIAKVRALPPEAQEEAARLLLGWADDLAREMDYRPPEPIDQADSAALAEALEDVRADRIASDAEVEAAYASFKSPR